MSALDNRRWLCGAVEPWTRYRTLVDLDLRAPDDPAVLAARADLVDAEPVRGLVDAAAAWPGYPLKRHNDAAHPLYAMATLADFGLDRGDSGIREIAEEVLGHFDGEAFESLLWLPRFLTKEDDDAEQWSWMLCDAPTLLYSLLAFGYGDHPAVKTAVSALVDRADDNGWRCGAAETLPKFSGPGRKADTCPMATTFALKALSLVPEAHDSPAVHTGIEAILSHWEHQADYKLKMFGIGTDFRKIKYPFIWYDILHVADVLSRFTGARTDPRLIDMAGELTGQADPEGRYTAGSMYRAWKAWGFADKRSASPWLTMLVLRIEGRMAAGV